MNDDLTHLEAELELQKQLVAEAQAMTAQVCAENEALRADAERYRWLRSDDIEMLPGQREIYVVMHRLPFSDEPNERLTESALDAAIDAAMKGKS